MNRNLTTVVVEDAPAQPVTAAEFEQRLREASARGNRQRLLVFPATTPTPDRKSAAFGAEVEERTDRGRT